MKYGDKAIIRDGSKVDGCIGVVYQLEEDKAVVLLDREVFWPVESAFIERLEANR